MTMIMTMIMTGCVLKNTNYNVLGGGTQRTM